MQKTMGGQRSRRTPQLIFALISACLLVACSTPRPNLISAPNGQPTQIEQSASGRFAVRHNLFETTASAQGRFVWLRGPHESVFTLYDPLGNSRAELRWFDHHASLTRAGEPTRYGADPQELLDELLGWPLPLALFPAWLQGRPADASVVMQNLTPTLRYFEEQNWKLELTTSGTGSLLQKLRVQRQIDSARSIDVRIQLDTGAQ